MMHFSVNKDFRLFMLLPNSENHPRLHRQTRIDSFCAGYCFAELYRSGDMDMTGILAMELGSTQQVNAILAEIRTKRNRNLAPGKDIFGTIERRIDATYFPRSTTDTTSPHEVKMSFISGFQTAMYVKGWSNQRPFKTYMDYRGSNLNEYYANVHKFTEEVMSALNEFYE